MPCWWNNEESIRAMECMMLIGGSEPEINKRLEVCRNGLVDDKYHHSAYDGLKVNRGGNKAVLGFFLK